MSKEIEYIQRQIDIVKQQVKGSNMKIIVIDAVTKHKYDYYERELQTLESIEQALHRLETIDNANPSEALECLDRIKTQLFGYFKSTDVRTDDIEDYEKLFFNPIKQALLKAQEQEKENELLKEIIKGTEI